MTRFGRLDALVGDAGGPPPGRALEVDDDQVPAAINASPLMSVRLVREAARVDGAATTARP